MSFSRLGAEQLLLDAISWAKQGQAFQLDNRGVMSGKRFIFSGSFSLHCCMQPGSETGLSRMLAGGDALSWGAGGREGIMCPILKQFRCSHTKAVAVFFAFSSSADQQRGCQISLSHNCANKFLPSPALTCSPQSRAHSYISI